MKKILKYQLSDLKNVIIIYYLIYVCIMVISLGITIAVSNDVYYSNGLEFSSVLVAFISGLALFKEHYWLVAQNSISRKSFYKSCLALSVIISAAMAIINLVLMLLFNLFDGSSYITLVQLYYPNYSGVASMLINIIYSIFLFFFCFVIGILVGLLYYKSNKIVKVLIAAGIPIFVFILLPVISTIFVDAWTKIVRIIYLVMGITHGNPVSAIITFLMMSLIFIGISYPVMKTTNIS